MDPIPEEFLIAVSPTEVDDRTGLYGWELTVDIEKGSDGVQLLTSGETAVVSAKSNPFFGEGWQLAGVPTLSVDIRTEDKTSQSLNSIDDRIVLAFPGETPRIFSAVGEAAPGSGLVFGVQTETAGRGLT